MQRKPRISDQALKKLNMKIHGTLALTSIDTHDNNISGGSDKPSIHGNFSYYILAVFDPFVTTPRVS